MTISFQILTPHIGLCLHSIYIFLVRCFDRRCSLNKSVTKRVIQADYEDLYTGPDFLLQIRYAQLLCTVFVTVSYSSGLPILYPIAAVSLFCMFWVDKILILRYHKITSGYTKWTSRQVVKIMPLAAVAHILFGFFMYSYPYILSSNYNSGWFGLENSKYFNSKRLGQHHMIVFICVSALILLLIIFEKSLTSLTYLITQSLSACCLRMCNRSKAKDTRNSDGQDDYGFAYSEDVYKEIDFQ